MKSVLPRPTADGSDKCGWLSVSIIIDNYNYGHFLTDAIDSALSQTYPHTEVIVVDDGSTDGSRDIIASYGKRIRPVYKENGGQASAFNAGFAASRGQVVIFLDSDDALYPDAIARLVARFAPGVSKVHGPLDVVDADGRPTGQTRAGASLPESSLRALVLDRGPSNVGSPPTSGNAWSRWFLSRVMPMPEAEYRTCADEYLYTLAPALGQVRPEPAPLGSYRIHASSVYSGKSFAERLRIELALYDQQCATIAAALEREGFEVNQAAWRRHSWFHRLDHSLAEIDRVMQSGEPFVLVDDDTWGREDIFADGRASPFLECGGRYWGPPADDRIASAELERLKGVGARFLVIAWPAFWWLDYYSQFFDHVRHRHPLVSESESLLIFDLSTN